MKELKEFILEAKEYNGDSYSKKLVNKIDALYKEIYHSPVDIIDKVRKFAMKEIKTLYKDIDEISAKIESTDTKTDDWVYLYISESKKLQEIFKKYYNHQVGDEILTLCVLNEYNNTTHFNTHVQFIWEDSGDADLDYYHKIIHESINWNSDDFEILNALECIFAVRELLKYTLYRLENNIPDDVKNNVLKDAVKLKGSDFTKSLVGVDPNDIKQEPVKPVVKQEPVKSVVKQEPVKSVKKLPKMVKDLQTSIQDKNWQTMFDTLKKIVKKYGNEYGDLYFTPSGRFWDHQIEGMRLIKNKLFINIYWTGDSTDGNELVKFIDAWNSGRYIIPKKTFFDGTRTRTTHGDIEVTKNEVIEYINKFINEYDWSKK
jgi:hypothetical protein